MHKLKLILAEKFLTTFFFFFKLKLLSYFEMFIFLMLFLIGLLIAVY